MKSVWVFHYTIAFARGWYCGGGHNFSGWKKEWEAENGWVGGIKVGWMMGEKERRKQEKERDYDGFQGKERTRKAKWLIRSS